LTDDSWNQFFANHSFIASADLPIQFGRAMQLNVGALANVSFAATPSGPQRSDFDLYADYHVQFSRNFSMDAVGRLLFKPYYYGDRTDVSELIALSADYRIRNWLTVSALTNFAWNQSNHHAFEYSVANLGGAISFTLKF
jgi:hypothetical protein